MAKNQTSKKDTSYGYNIVDEIDTGGRYLSFRRGDKGRIIQVRLVSPPRYVNQHWILGDDGRQTPIKCKGADCPYCGDKVPPKEKLEKVARWGWIVIDRENGNPKVFTGPTLIARKVKELVEDSEWGDPFLYDLKIKRTEEPGVAYYQVTPVPTGKGNSITKEEKEAVEKANFNLEEELEGGRESKHLGNYTPPELETAPEGKTEELLNEGDPISF